MMFCANCGKEVDEDMIFCPECGANARTGEKTAYEKGNSSVTNSGEKKSNVVKSVLIAVGCIFAVILLFSIFGENKIDRLLDKTEKIIVKMEELDKADYSDKSYDEFMSDMTKLYAEWETLSSDIESIDYSDMTAEQLERLYNLAARMSRIGNEYSW